MRTVKVTFSNNDSITTGINGTDDKIKDYYKVGRYFNLGRVDDLMVKVVSCEILK
jgi:hypothetical protein